MIGLWQIYGAMDDSLTIPVLPPASVGASLVEVSPSQPERGGSLRVLTPEQRARHNALTKIWRQNHPEEYERRKLRTPIEKRMRDARMGSSRYYYRHKEKVQRRHADWLKKNPQYISEWTKKWRKKHPVKARTNDCVHDIRRRSVPNSKDASLVVQQIKNKKRGKCFYCGKVRRLTIEHLTPLSRGGHHSAFNIVGACWKCNCSKKAKTPNEFIQIGQLVLI